MLAGFMEERNIRWIELIGGLLFVGSSAALEQQTWWIAAACGIAPSAGILALGMFWEKRRNDVLAAVERFQKWEG